MKSFVISYDLIGPNRDYDSLYTAIMAYGTYAQVTESLWIVNSNSNSASIRDNLKLVLDENDKLIVLELQGNWASSNISKEVNDWLKSNV